MRPLVTIPHSLLSRHSEWYKWPQLGREAVSAGKQGSTSRALHSGGEGAGQGEKAVSGNTDQQCILTLRLISRLTESTLDAHLLIQLQTVTSR